MEILFPYLYDGHLVVVPDVTQHGGEGGFEAHLHLLIAVIVEVTNGLDLHLVDVLPVLRCDLYGAVPEDHLPHLTI